MQEKTIEVLGETVSEAEAIEALYELIDETDNGILLERTGGRCDPDL